MLLPASPTAARNYSASHAGLRTQDVPGVRQIVGVGFVVAPRITRENPDDRVTRRKAEIGASARAPIPPHDQSRGITAPFAEVPDGGVTFMPDTVQAESFEHETDTTLR